MTIRSNSPEYSTKMKWIFTIWCCALVSSQAQTSAYKSIETSGKSDQHVSETSFFFSGEDCYGAKRSYKNMQMHVIIPKVYWDLYYDGKLIATVDPEARNLISAKVPAEMEFRKELSHFYLSKNNKYVRVWHLQHDKLAIASKEQLDKLSSNQSSKTNLGKMLRSYPIRFQAPTLAEAKKSMTLREK